MNEFVCNIRLDLPYPEVTVDEKNREYADIMLDNMAGCVSEMSAVSLYFYNSLISKEYNESIAKCFSKISIVEMHHLDTFGELAVLLGADPRLWSRRRHGYQYWSPGFLSYPRQIEDVIRYSIQSEREAIDIYMQQSKYIKDENIVEIIGRIILDEEKHVQVFESMLSFIEK